MFIDIEFLLKRYSISKPTFYTHFRNNPQFPKPYMIGRLPRYKLSEIEVYEKTLQH